jgi:hypothetical protein
LLQWGSPVQGCSAASGFESCARRALLSIAQVDGPAMHQIGANQPGKSERAVNDFLRGLSQKEQQEPDRTEETMEQIGKDRKFSGSPTFAAPARTQCASRSPSP